MVVKITETNLNAYKQLFQEAFNYLKNKKLLREIDKNLTTFTTLEHYFSYIEFLKHNSHFLLNTPISDSFTIDPNSKIIKDPASFSNHTIIQTDSGIDMITFKIDRFFSSIDLANATAFVQWTAPDETGISQREFASACQIDLLDEVNMIKIGWIIDGDITKYSGDLSFALTFFIKDPENLENDIIRLNTQPMKIAIKPALHSEVGLNWSDPFDKVESAILNNKYTGKIPYPQSPKFSGVGYDLPSEANLVQDTLTLKAQAYVTDLGEISYQWRFTPLGETRPLICSSKDTDRSFICKPDEYISETIYNFLVDDSQNKFELVKVGDEYKYRLIKAENTTVYYKEIGRLGTSFEKVNIKNFKPALGEEYYSPDINSDLEKETIETEIFYAENAILTEEDFQEIDFIKVEDTYIPIDNSSIVILDYFSDIRDTKNNIKGYSVIKRNGVNVKVIKENQYKKVYYDVDNNKFTLKLGESIANNTENIYEKFSTFTIPQTSSESSRMRTYKVVDNEIIKYNEYNQIKYIRKDGKNIEKEDLATEYFKATLINNPINSQEKIITGYEVIKDVDIIFKEEDVVGTYQVFAKNTVIFSYPTSETNPETGELIYEQLTNSSFEQGSKLCNLLGPLEISINENFKETEFLQTDKMYKKDDSISKKDFDLILNEDVKSSFRLSATDNNTYIFDGDSQPISMAKTTLSIKSQTERGSASYSWKYSDNSNDKIEASLSDDSKTTTQEITKPGWYKVIATSKLNRKELLTESKVCRVVIPKSKIPVPTLKITGIYLNESNTSVNLIDSGEKTYIIPMDGPGKVKISFEASISNIIDGQTLDSGLISDQLSYSLQRQAKDIGATWKETNETGEFNLTFDTDPGKSNDGFGEYYICTVKNELNGQESSESVAIQIRFT